MCVAKKKGKSTGFRCVSIKLPYYLVLCQHYKTIFFSVLSSILGTIAVSVAKCLRRKRKTRESRLQTQDQDQDKETKDKGQRTKLNRRKTMDKRH